MSAKFYVGEGVKWRHDDAGEVWHGEVTKVIDNDGDISYEVKFDKYCTIGSRPKWTRLNPKQTRTLDEDELEEIPAGETYGDAQY